MQLKEEMSQLVEVNHHVIPMRMEFQWWQFQSHNHEMDRVIQNRSNQGLELGWLEDVWMTMWIQQEKDVSQMTIVHQAEWRQEMNIAFQIALCDDLEHDLGTAFQRVGHIVE